MEIHHVNRFEKFSFMRCLGLIAVLSVSLLLFITLVPVNVSAQPPVGFQKTDVLGPSTNLSTPVAFEFAPDGRIFVVEKKGIVVIAEKSGVVDSVPLINISSKINAQSERGLLGIAIDPNFSTKSPYVYLFYTNAVPLESHVSRFKMLNNNQLDPNSEVVLLKSSTPRATYHQSGGLRVSPDGYLYATFGENGQNEHKNMTTNSALPNAHNPDIIDGKIARIFLNGTIPKDNPYVNKPGFLPQIWAYGLRNPFRFGLLPNGIPIIGDVGQANWEDIDVAKKGLDFTWAKSTSPQDGPCINCGYANPVYAYAHNYTVPDWTPGKGIGTATCTNDQAFLNVGVCLSSSVTAGLVISNNNYPAPWNGMYFFGDYVKHFVRALQFDQTYSSVVGGPYTFDTSLGDVVDFRQGPDGNLYALIITGDNKTGSTSGHGGTIFKYSFKPITSPTLSITSPANNTFSKIATVAVTGTASSNVAISTVTWKVDSGTPSLAIGTTSWSFTTTALSNGPHTMQVNATDALAKMVTQILGITIDTIPPTLSITTPANNTVSSTAAVAVSGTAADNFAIQSVTWKVDGGTLATAAGTSNWSFTTSALPNGPHNIQINASDTSGNVVTKKLGITVSATTTLVKVTLKTNHPQPLVVSLNGTQYVTPITLSLPAGSNWQISTTTPQSVTGHTYTFTSWSDGGAIAHMITIPSAATTYSANFQYHQ